jgi:heterodisulfide reductase subunit A-like polyferredoxin
MNDQIKTVSRTRGAVLIVGAGIGGMQAALDLAKEFTPMQLAEMEAVKQKAVAQSPIFRYPMG